VWRTARPIFPYPSDDWPTTWSEKGITSQKDSHVRAICCGHAAGSLLNTKWPRERTSPQRALNTTTSSAIGSVTERIFDQIRNNRVLSYLRGAGMHPSRVWAHTPHVFAKLERTDQLTRTGRIGTSLPIALLNLDDNPWHRPQSPQWQLSFGLDPSTPRIRLVLMRAEGTGKRTGRAFPPRCPRVSPLLGLALHHSTV